MVIKTRICQNKNEKRIAVIEHETDLRYIQELLGPESSKKLRFTPLDIYLTGFIPILLKQQKIKL